MYLALVLDGALGLVCLSVLSAESVIQTIMIHVLRASRLLRAFNCVTPNHEEIEHNSLERWDSKRQDCSSVLIGYLAQENFPGIDEPLPLLVSRCVRPTDGS